MKVALVQDGPEFNNLEATIEKTCDFIREASLSNADMIIFGESWLSGYPFWLDICTNVAIWDHPPIKELWAATYQNSVDITQGDLKLILKCIKDAGLYCVLGLNEKISKGKGNHTIYNSVVIISPEGQILNHHRKLMPTYTEKLVYGLGDGAGLHSVETKFGNIGALICWEHWMPMTRQSMHDEAEDLHIALWPYVKESHHLASKHYPIEGRCHVISVGQICEKNELPKGLELSDHFKNELFFLKGGSAIYNPNGEYIIEPLYNERKLIIEEIELITNQSEYMNLSVSGHYQRPDVFNYSVNKERQ